jgi:phytoene dehydrogenase-like protein
LTTLTPASDRDSTDWTPGDWLTHRSMRSVMTRSVERAAQVRSAHAGAQSASQVGPMRPMLGWAQHRMPIPGLYQTGATTHPGGSVTGGPGRNAATVMLKDFGTSIEEVVNKNA